MRTLFLSSTLLLVTPSFTQTIQVDLVPWATGLAAAVDIAHCGDDRLFVVQQSGLISIVTDSMTVLQTPFLDLTDVLTTALETSRPLIEHAQHELRLRIHDGTYLVHGDKTRLAQIISNLLNNAAKYTPTGGLIELELERKAGHIVLCVKDNGIGIAASDMARIFDMFAQVKDAMPGSGGLGIGLNLAQRLATMHDGSLTAHSEGAGKGCAFTLELPVVEAPETGSPDDLAHRPVEPSRILVVDDNQDGATSLVQLLRKRSHEVSVAFDGADALKQGEQLRPDLVLMDLGMPVMDGCTACEHMRKVPWGQRAYIVAVSGWGQTQDRVRTTMVGFNEHLIKPLDPNSLDRVLRAMRHHVQGQHPI